MKHLFDFIIYDRKNKIVKQGQVEVDADYMLMAEQRANTKIRRHMRGGQSVEFTLAGQAAKNFNSVKATKAKAAAK
jgi:hypothetical protein